MKLHMSSDSGLSYEVIVPRHQEERMKKTSFRGVGVARAGNFRLWQSAKEILKNQEVKPLFIAALDALVEKLDKNGSATKGTVGITIMFQKMVGWSCSDDLLYHMVPAPEFERCDFSRRAFGLRVKPDCEFRLAPLTPLVTFAGSTAKVAGGWRVIIHSIYPGQYVKLKSGDISRKNEVVFFDYAHPGREYESNPLVDANSIPYTDGESLPRGDVLIVP